MKRGSLSGVEEVVVVVVVVVEVDRLESLEVLFLSESVRVTGMSVRFTNCRVL